MKLFVSINELAMGQVLQSTLNTKLNGQGAVCRVWQRSGVLFISMDTTLAEISTSKNRPAAHGSPNAYLRASILIFPF